MVANGSSFLLTHVAQLFFFPLGIMLNVSL